MDLNEKLLIALECPVCLEPTGGQIRCCTSGHLVCQGCLTLLGGVTARCPLCRQLIMMQRNVFVEKVAELVQFQCAYRSVGCNEEIGCGYTAFATHKRVCQFVVGANPCQFIGCNLKHLPVDLLSHWQTEHPFFVVEGRQLQVSVITNVSGSHDYLMRYDGRAFRVRILVDMTHLVLRVAVQGSYDSRYLYRVNVVGDAGFANDFVANVHPFDEDWESLFVPAGSCFSVGLHRDRSPLLRIVLDVPHVAEVYDPDVPIPAVAGGGEGGDADESDDTSSEWEPEQVYIAGRNSIYFEAE